MKTDYKKAIKALIRVGKSNRLFYYKIENTDCYFVTDGCCIITVPSEDFEEIPTYAKVGLIENPSIFKCIEDIKENKGKQEATKTSLLFELDQYGNTKKTTRVYMLDNKVLVPVNNAYVEIVENTIYQDNVQYCNGLNTKTAINYIDVNIHGNIVGGFAIVPINLDVKGKLEYLLGL